jgi:hypothetical protein
MKYTLNYLDQVGVDAVWRTENDVLILERALKKRIYIISDKEPHLNELKLAALHPE